MEKFISGCISERKEWLYLVFNFFKQRCNVPDLSFDSLKNAETKATD